MWVASSIACRPVPQPATSRLQGSGRSDGSGRVGRLSAIRWASGRRSPMRAETQTGKGWRSYCGDAVGDRRQARHGSSQPCLLGRLGEMQPEDLAEFRPGGPEPGLQLGQHLAETAVSGDRGYRRGRGAGAGSEIRAHLRDQRLDPLAVLRRLLEDELVQVALHRESDGEAKRRWVVRCAKKFPAEPGQALLQLPVLDRRRAQQRQERRVSGEAMDEAGRQRTVAEPDQHRTGGRRLDELQNVADQVARPDAGAGEGRGDVVGGDAVVRRMRAEGHRRHLLVAVRRPQLRMPGEQLAEEMERGAQCAAGPGQDRMVHDQVVGDAVEDRRVALALIIGRDEGREIRAAPGTGAHYVLRMARMRLIASRMFSVEAA
jgi:hypothetical protein